MPLNPFTGMSSMDDVLRSEEIEPFVAGFEYPATLWERIAWMRPGKGNIPIQFARIGEITVPAGTKAETVEAEDANMSTDSEQITPAIVQFRFPISDEVVASAEIGVPQAAVEEGIAALHNRLDSDGMSTTTSLTESTGSVGRDYTMAEFRKDVFAYIAMNIPAGPSGTVAAISAAMAEDLIGSMTESAATNARLAGDTLNLKAQMPGLFLGNFRGVDVYIAKNAAVEGLGHSGVMTEAGFRFSALGGAINNAPKVVVTRGTEGESRAVTFLHFRFWAGFNVVNPRRGLELLGK